MKKENRYLGGSKQLFEHTFIRTPQKRGSDQKGVGSYYPFGLTMAGISDKAIKTGYAENKYRFQKQELQNKEFNDGSGLEMYEFKHRFDDPQVGRFWQIDPIADSFPHNSTYAFSEDKVTTHVELEGLEAAYINSKAEGELATIYQAAADGMQKLLGHFSVFNQSSTSTQIPSTTTSVGTTMTTTVTPDFSNFMSNLIRTDQGSSDQMFKTDVSVTTDVKIDIPTPAGTVTSKTSVNTSTGTVTQETGGKVNVIVDDVPGTASSSVAVSTNGQTSVKAQYSAGGNTQATVQTQYTTKGNQQSISVGVGGQSRAGNTTFSTLFGFKYTF